MGLRGGGAGRRPVVAQGEGVVAPAAPWRQHAGVRGGLLLEARRGSHVARVGGHRVERAATEKEVRERVKNKIIVSRYKILQ